MLNTEFFAFFVKLILKESALTVQRRGLPCVFIGALRFFVPRVAFDINLLYTVM